MTKVGAVLAAVAMVVALAGGLGTRGILNNLRDNSSELLQGSTAITLDSGAQRTLYVAGGLIAPGESAPTPVEEIQCTIAGPEGAVPFEDLASQGKRVGLDNPLVRFQVVGSFQAQDAGSHTIECTGLGVIVAPEVSPVGAVAALGGLALGSLGTFLGVMMLVLGGGLLLFVRPSEEDEEELEDEPPAEGAQEWWQEGAAAVGEPEDDYVDLTPEELASLSDEQIAELEASGALIFIDEDLDEPASATSGEPDDQGDDDPQAAQP